MFTKEFEEWWNRVGVYKATALADLPTAKKLAWEAWRAGREKFHEETIHLHLQRA